MSGSLRGSYTVEAVFVMAVFLGLLLMVTDTAVQFYQEVEADSGMTQELMDFSAVEQFRRIHMVEGAVGGLQ